MRSEVRVLIDERQEFTFELGGVEPMAPDLARWWLDEQFTRLGCEPLRPTGKVLIADKVLCVAQAAGKDAVLAAGQVEQAVGVDHVLRQFIGDADTSKLLRREYREHWATPVG